jgi:hypothetical protein
MSKTPKEGDLRVWHIPQVPMKAFRVPVASAEEAIKLINVLANYDLFQFENNIKPDYCNVNGLEVFENGEWLEWENEDGSDISAHERQIEERGTRDTATAEHSSASLTQKSEPPDE